MSKTAVLNTIINYHTTIGSHWSGDRNRNVQRVSTKCIKTQIKDFMMQALNLFQTILLWMYVPGQVQMSRNVANIHAWPYCIQ